MTILFIEMFNSKTIETDIPNFIPSNSKTKIISIKPEIMPSYQILEIKSVIYVIYESISFCGKSSNK